MDTDATVEMEVVPQHHFQPVIQGPMTYWQRCRYNIMAPPKAFRNMRNLNPLAVTNVLYLLIVSRPSAPTFDILTLYETHQGCLTLLMFLLINVLLLQRLHTVEEN
ncbi:b9d5c0be-559c-46ff-b9ab-4e218c2868cf [Sclerotinia trifoliorum]|uniref:B9d5c0be-559c-46ff-b9ab-4e218c2868cf n=1 Tax=Sclerotinia trifoliorum TaxID=28548 RepID=A0A8H2VUM4_9HELO|nr:b9d5c0be-559c-46ff-b9ab-4e218c2868cf [Sclerotinia trifoliorum]